jgi:hypothetical protein
LTGASARSRGRLRRLAAASLVTLACAGPAAWAAQKTGCKPAELELWGDGRHDDTRALNAWFKGDRVAWAETGQPVGPEIVGRSFLLSSTIYIPSGTGRRIERFQMIWPARRERVSGDAIVTGDEPDKPAVTVGIVKIGAGPDEGVPYRAPAVKPDAPIPQVDCLIS